MIRDYSQQHSEEKPSALPNGWEWTSLDHVVDILDGRRVPVSADEREKRVLGKPLSDLYPYYGATGQIGWIDDYLFDGELVLVGEDGAPFLDPSKNKAYVVKGKSWVNNHAHVLKALIGITSNAYLCHYLNLFDYHGYVTGTTRMKLNQAPMRKIPIPLAPYSEQRRIVAKVEELFTKLDAGVKSLETVKAQLKLYHRSVLKLAFEGKLTEEWRRTHRDELEPASKLLERIREERRKSTAGKYKEPPPVDTTSLPEHPEDWVWTSVGEVATRIQYGSSERATEDPSGVPVLRMGNIQEGRLIFDDLKYFSKDHPQLDDFMLGPGDVLFNRTNSPELVGKTAVYEHWHPEAAFASYLIRVKVNDKIYDPHILAFFINSYYGRRYIASVVSQQVGQANVNGTKLSAMPIPLISLSEQKAIAEEIKRRFSIADEVEKTIINNARQAEKLRQSILKRAFEGRLVSQDPTDEPASALLERIRSLKTQIEHRQRTRKPKWPNDHRQRRLA